MGTQSRVHRRRIGELLVTEGLVTSEQVDDALEQQQETGERLGQILLSSGVITESDITKTICLQYQLPFLTLSNYQYDPKLVETFPREFLHQHNMLPFDRLGKTLMILVGEIPEPEVLEEVPRRTNLNAALYVGYLTEVSKLLSDLAPLPTGVTVHRKSAAPPKKKKPAGPSMEIVPSTEASADEEGKAKAPLIFGEDTGSFLEELDTTWDSIFQETNVEVQATPVDDEDEDEDSKSGS